MEEIKHINVDFTQKCVAGEIELPLSKSLLNRVLVLHASHPEIAVTNDFVADDVEALRQALQAENGEVNIGLAGTAMRFATAWFAAQAGKNVLLTGADRMKKRPIGALVEALRKLGAQIDYANERGFPPLKITGKRLLGGAVKIDARESSQFATALMLIAPQMENGISLEIAEDSVSFSYVKMTANLMNELGFDVLLSPQEVKILPRAKVPQINYQAEADWSAASFWYGIVALQHEAKIQLNGLRENSLQGDAKLVDIFKILGVRTIFNAAGACIEKGPTQLPAKLVLNLENNPDLAQPLAVVCAALGVATDFRGLQTLPLKETNRLVALKNELAKVGCEVEITARSLSFSAQKLNLPTRCFSVYNDHRMAMSLAILGFVFPVQIEHPEVVSKSYPAFWQHLQALKTRA